MRRERVWKSLAGMVGAGALVLSAAGVAGAAQPPHESGPQDPPINCATAEHVGFGVVWHAFNECPGSHNAVDGN